MLDAAQKEIDAFYGRYADKEQITLAEAKRRVSKLDIAAYQRKAKRYVADKDFSKQANEEMRLYNLTMKVNRLEMLKANIGLELVAGHNEQEQFMAKILRGRTEEELQRQAGILGKTVRNNAKLAETLPNASFHGATFSERIWGNQAALKAELSKQLQVGMIQGKNPRVLARKIQKTFGASASNAERLMRTELARVQTEAQRQSFLANGFEEYTFHANRGCCSACADLDGKHFKVKDMMPGKNAPPMHPNCRCSASAYEDDAEYEAWLDFLDKGGTTEVWERRLQIDQPGSPQSYRRSLKQIAEGRAGLSKRRKNILARIQNTGEYHRYKREEISTRDLAYLSAATGHEFALFRSKREDILIRGNSRACDIAGELGEEILNKHYKWVAHSHVDGGFLTASLADRETLRKLGQKSSIIVGINGEETEFFQSEFDY
ncbi:MAG: minor capsid protein [Eubacteriales bacterium]|nr:minor capsid protein [Eubacteriales bacterium]